MSSNNGGMTSFFKSLGETLSALFQRYLPNIGRFANGNPYVFHRN
jgi:hypothetical protein